MVQRQADLQSQKKEHEQLQAQGLQYVTDLELGDAPPLKYMLLNSSSVGVDSTASILGEGVFVMPESGVSTQTHAMVNLQRSTISEREHRVKQLKDDRGQSLRLS